MRFPCLVLVLLVDQVISVIFRGHPYLGNCFREEKVAKEQYYLVKNGLSLTPKWSDAAEFEKDSYLPEKFVWTYFVQRRTDPDIEYSEEDTYNINEFRVPNTGTITIPPFTGTPGFYTMKINVTAKAGLKITNDFINMKCYFYIKAQSPMAVIVGGPEKIVPDNMEIIVSGQHSLDPNKPIDRNNIETMKFHWTCVQKETPTFCGKEPIATTIAFHIPPEYVVKNEVFNITLSLTNVFEITTTAMQKITVIPDAAILSIRCEKNCLPITDAPNVQAITFLRAHCEKNCKGIENQNYIWEIKPIDTNVKLTFDYRKQTHFGPTGPKFVISKNALRADEYQIILRLRSSSGRVGITSLWLSFAKPPKVDRCEIIPSTGISLVTKFKLKCVEKPPPDRSNFYELHIDTIGANMVVSGFYGEISDTTFFLPPSSDHEFIVKVTKMGGPAAYLKVSPKVLSVSDGKTPHEVVEVYKKFFDGSKESVSDMLLSKDESKKAQGIKRFQALVNEIVVSKIATNQTVGFIKNLTQKVVQDVLKSVPEKVPDLVIMNDSVTKLINHHELSRLNPLLAKMATTICKLMIDKHIEEVKKQAFPANSEEQTNLVESTLRKCLEANVRESFHLLTPVPRNITIADLPPLQLEANIVESYPNYVDYDENYEERMDNFLELTENVIDATAKAAKTLAFTMIEGEHSGKRSGAHSATLVAKDQGAEISLSRINLLDVVLIPSKDFVDSDHPFDLLMSVWTKDLMWWNHGKTRAATSILNVQFWHSSCRKRIRHFKSFCEIGLQVKSEHNFDVRPQEDNVTVPEGYLDMTPEDLNHHIRVHRVGFPKHSALYVQFYNVTEENDLDVVLTQFEFPTIEHFSGAHFTISSVNHSLIKVINERNYDVWGYLGVLPNRENVRNGTASPILSYGVSFESSFCIRWVKSKRSWELECRPDYKTSREVVICRCSHFSIIAGYFQNAISIVQEVFTIEIVLELQACYIIFITIAITYFLFCVLSMLTLFRTKREVYFLADNSWDDRYAYLIIVRTDGSTSAGTTSKVVIRLRGAKQVSEPHVLNYPDPKMRLLQSQGEDMFVLTTQYHLGDIKEIELWFDCSGPSTSWNCRDIVVYDMQTRVQVYFKLRTLFSVEKDGLIYLCTGPAEEKKRGRGTISTRVCNHFHTWKLWAGENNFSYMKRLTVVFSNMLMTYMFVLLMLGPPTLELRDCLDPFQNYMIDNSVFLIAFQCSLMSFLIHLLISWAFRFSQIEFSILDTVYHKSHKLSGFFMAILCLLIMISTSYLIVYGFWAPVVLSLMWLTCSLLAFVLNVLILENIFIIIQTSICKFKLKVSFDKRYTHILQNIEAQRLYLYTKFDETLFRPFLKHLYIPLRRAQIIRRKIVVELRQSIYDDLEDLFMYGLYNIILYIFILVNKGTLTTVSKDELESMVEGAHTRTLPFSSVSSIHQIYQYLNETLIPVMQPTAWYENYSITDAGMMMDNANKLIGVARLRQHRIIANVCTIPEHFQFLSISSCHPEFSLNYAETADFWQRWKTSRPVSAYDRLRYIWKYSTADDTETLGTVGRIATYSGGGYVAFLGRTLYNSYVNLFRLLELVWIDHQTRSLFIEFLVYNANYNVFVAVNLLFEQSATGYTSKFVEVDVVRMLFVQNEMEVMSMVFFVLFTGWVMMLMLKLSVGIVKNIHVFYKKVWLMIDLLINLMSIISITMFILRIQMVKRYLNSLEAVKHNDFVSYFNMLYLEEFLTYFAGLLVCIATARLWKFLRFGQFFRIMERTLAMASFPLLAVTFSFAVIITAFALCGILIFSNEYVELSFFIKIVATLIQLSLKPDQFDLTQFTTFLMAYYYFALYLMMMQIILLVYIIVIIMAYTKARLELSCAPDSYTVKDYIKERGDYIPIYVKSLISRLRAGTVLFNPVTPKADEFRYANCLGILRSRLQSMRFIVSCIFRNMRQRAEEQTVLTNHEAELMLGVCNTFVLKRTEDDEHELFFKGHFEGQKIQLVDERRIMKIAEFVQIMFRGSKEEDLPKSKSDEELTQCSKKASEQIQTIQKIRLLLRLQLLHLDNAEQVLTSLLQE